MRQLPKNKISVKALTVWRLSAMIIAGVLLLVAIGAGVGIHLLEWPYYVTIIIAAVWLTYSIVTIFIIPKIKHRVWRYEVHEHEIDLQYGFFIVKRVLIPMVRVQHVDTHQGPLLRKHHLASIEISTAATTHEIPALDIEEAEALRDKISNLARVNDDDV
ncbi:PH domain-containing protein [Metabacillus malikii]|uniref:Membrane protein YdbS with pleckstrin-like domain n=1 Tax=Metabacillus malikii TaxID=1504265 RepID=A0ABT9ZJM5_9BACI|nr:PH domain-containing protein [Metabacillus malikii]MDQ0232495.1 membrane protein YdbS with pleckstrin-like domain [Metabacillus malikii]